jgi:aminobenzoyl-glutamate utilization protein B
MAKAVFSVKVERILIRKSITVMDYSDSMQLKCALLASLFSAIALCQTAPHQQIVQLVDRHAAHFSATSKTIWDYAELGYHEQKSSALLQRELQAAGFRVESGVAGEPTAFVATFGQGSPVIGIMGEFDALPGLSQAAVPDRDPVVPGGPGHGCGHNLLGSGAALAAVALKDYMEQNHVAGTLRYYGTPAEEGGDGKVYMIRAGLFRDTDVVLHWHPSNENVVANGGALSINGARFLFHGVAAHAALAPERGRSALDAVMLMGNGIEFLREHVPSNTRIHYIITNGGAAPNIVPDTAELYLYARNPQLAVLSGIWDRILKIGQGAALMTDTTLEVKDISGDANLLPNDALGKVAQRNLEEVGGFHYTPEEKHFAEELQKSLPPGGAGDLDSTAIIKPLKRPDPNEPAASTDAGDVSWNVPTIGFGTATFVPGVVAHTWQAAACAGMSIGQRGMVNAAKVLALTGADLFSNPQLVADAKADFKRELAGKSYQSVIPEGQKPPIEYRKQ